MSEFNKSLFDALKQNWPTELIKSAFQRAQSITPHALPTEKLIIICAIGIIAEIVDEDQKVPSTIEEYKTTLDYQRGFNFAILLLQETWFGRFWVKYLYKKSKISSSNTPAL